MVGLPVNFRTFATNIWKTESQIPEYAYFCWRWDRDHWRGKGDRHSDPIEDKGFKKGIYASMARLKYSLMHRVCQKSSKHLSTMKKCMIFRWRSCVSAEKRDLSMLLLRNYGKRMALRQRDYYICGDGLRQTARFSSVMSISMQLVHTQRARCEDTTWKSTRTNIKAWK